MGLSDFLGSIFKPVTELVDNVSTTDEERLKLRNALASIEAQVSMKLLDAESKAMSAQQEIQKIDAQSDNIVQKGWRPVVIGVLTLLVCLDAFNFVPNMKDFVYQAWLGLTVGAGVLREGFKAVRAMKK